MLEQVSEFLWWERLWLPQNVSWSDLQDGDGLVYARPSHLYLALPCAFALLLVRYLFESYLASPLAEAWGIRDRRRLPPEPSCALDAYFRHTSHCPSQAEVRSLCKKTSWSERRVQVWFRRRRNQDRAGLCKRFCEASWRCTFYLFAFLGGILALYDDFKEQVVHHIATLTLLAFSWASNYIRIGTLVMATHDSADILLEGAKILNYAKWKRSADTMFVVFTLIFALTRMVILPFWLIHCTWVYPVERFEPFFGYYFFNAMLVVLQILHFYWGLLISKMLYKCLFSKLEGDERSDEEEEDRSDEEEEGREPPKKENQRLDHTTSCRPRGWANGI
ncbi:ceramide synthase 2 isoform X2 [Gadus macrocephalus]|uniref:ceramide synthase 2 isoform X2 n=1 Tax=Gadus macrocephalus TaxID=80720 RepID=UPI0028CB8A22|nr:ceramide synthase 2 isoform X2 [Gadus macrocephalus]